MSNESVIEAINELIPDFLVAKGESNQEQFHEISNKIRDLVKQLNEPVYCPDFITDLL